jgi:hypothetical protein
MINYRFPDVMAELQEYVKALLLFHNDAHNHKITGILKQLNILTVGIFNCFNIPVIL